MKINYIDRSHHLVEWLFFKIYILQHMPMLDYFLWVIHPYYFLNLCHLKGKEIEINKISSFNEHSLLSIWAIVKNIHKLSNNWQLSFSQLFINKSRLFNTSVFKKILKESSNSDEITRDVFPAHQHVFVHYHTSISRNLWYT